MLHPEIILKNVAGMMDTSGVVQRVLPDGTCTVTQSINATAKARLNLRRYPFDRQTLEAAFAVLAMDADEVRLEALPNPAADLAAVRVPQWDLREVTATTHDAFLFRGGAKKNQSTFVVKMEVRRQAMFLLRLVALPVLLIVFLSWSIFWMDRSSLGDRMSVSFVGVLTVVAYQVVVGDILPHISYVTLINAFLNFSFFLMCATVLENLLIGACERRRRPDLAERLDRVSRWAFPMVYLILLAGATVAAFVFF